MARHGLSRPAGPIERHAPPAHDVWRRDLFTGTLGLRLVIAPGQYVSPGTGRLALTGGGEGGGEIVAQQAATARGLPVLPGSGIKGAVRTLYELLSFSCDPFDREGERCLPAACCDACSLFGLFNHSGRLSFADAVAAEPEGGRVEVQMVPVPWTPNAGKTPGEFRLYDLAEAALPGAGRPAEEKQPKELARQVYLGTFETRMAFTNLEPAELGRVLLAMGVGTDRTTRFSLRLGGVKYDGKGAVKVVPHHLRLVKPSQMVAHGLEACGEEYVRWIGAARDSPWAATFWAPLERLAAVLGKAD
jgi:hypothetical protein